MPGSIVVDSDDPQATLDDRFTRQSECALRVDHSGQHIRPARPQNCDSLRDDFWIAGDFDGGIDTTRLSGDRAKLQCSRLTRGVLIPAEDFRYTTVPQERAGVQAEQARALDEDGSRRHRNRFDGVDHRRERTVGRNHRGVRELRWNSEDRRSGPKQDVRCVTAIEARAVAYWGVAILEEGVALLGQVMFGAARATAA